MIKYLKILQLSLFIPLLTISCWSHASTDADKVQMLLSQAVAPSGVVFEIASSDADGLKWAIPRIQHYTKTLREKFPGLEVAIVSHGREQFALQEEKAAEYQQVHDSVKELTTKGNVPVHICQTFAGWKGVEPEQFPEYVTVSATGPQQVRDYVELGYTLIKIRRN